MDNAEQIPVARHGRRHSRKARQTGVTLLELMTVVVVVGVLAVIAVPSYRQYTIRANRTEAKNALLRLATNQERYYVASRTYADAVDNRIGFTAATSENGVYSMALTTNAGWTQDFTATATPIAGGGTNGVDQSGDPDCAQLSIDSTGVKDATAPPGGVKSRCW
ncbi:MAG TPA: type IV pilin protein [Gammaproteobacteria bacterium]|jgi:type IV pilus assembly protein PilE|nr:type IV pilin protein [Gammaproteobacteria bacterium]